MIQVRRAADGHVLLTRVRRCRTISGLAWGFMFRRRLRPGEGRLWALWPGMPVGIHMYWVFCHLGVIWLDAQRRVVAKTVARSWRAYHPSVAASYILEGPPALAEQVQVGEALEWEG